MPESVNSLTYGRSLGWTINSSTESKGWSTRENDVIKALARQVGLRGAIRFINYQDHGSFDNMLSDLGDDSPGAARYTVLIPDDVAIALDTSVNANLTLIRTQNGRFTIAGGATLTFTEGSKLITEPDVQVFDVSAGSAGIGGVWGGNALEFVTPQMFGSGETGLIDMLDSFSYVSPPDTLCLRILQDITLTTNLTFGATIDIEYIQPGIQFTINNGVTLTINSMSATYTHDPFNKIGTGNVVLNHGALRQQFLMIRDSMSTPTAPEGYACLFFDSSDGNNPKIVDSAGNVFRLTITPEA